MAQHTPGPWQPFDIDGKPVNDPSIASEKHVLATVWINDLSRKQAVANAILMAAAPEMLAALIKLDQLLDLDLDPEGARDWAKQMGMDESGADGLLEACRDARFAIAKAEGRS